MPQPISFLRAFALAWGAVICPLSLLLLFSVVTNRGILFAIGALLLGMAPLLAWLKPDVRKLRICAFVAVLGWLGIAIWLVSVSPNGHARAGARVENRYVGGAWHYPRTALGSLLPEVDQFMMGFRIVPLLDSLLTFKQARAVSADTKEIYAALEADPDFHALGSVMPEAYQELWGPAPMHGHYFLYVPPSLDRKKESPALLFLHGSGGNFKSYTWLLSKVADECGMVLIAPTFGFGNWPGKRSVGLVSSVLQDAAKVLPIDMSQVHLAGLSNGGLGVSRVAASEIGDWFRSLILLSPVTDSRAIASLGFKRWRDKPVLVITGEADDRVPVDYVRESSDAMRRAGANVALTKYPGVDHFLFFSQSDKLLKELAQWLKPK